MRLLRLCALFLAGRGLTAAAYTLDQVETQVSAYLQGAADGTLRTRGQSLSGCTLAVSTHSVGPVPHAHLLTHTVWLSRVCATIANLEP